MILAKSRDFLLIPRISNVLSALCPTSPFPISLHPLTFTLPSRSFLLKLKAHAPLLHRNIVLLIAEVTIEQILVIPDELESPMRFRVETSLIIKQIANIQFLKGVRIPVHVNIIGKSDSNEGA